MPRPASLSTTTREKVELLLSIVIDGAIAAAFLLVSYVIKLVFREHDMAAEVIIRIGEIGAIATFTVLVAAEIHHVVMHKVEEFAAQHRAPGCAGTPNALRTSPRLFRERQATLLFELITSDSTCRRQATTSFLSSRTAHRESSSIGS